MDRSSASLALLLAAMAGCSTMTDEHAYVLENQQRECLRQPTSQIQPCLQRAEADYASYKSQAERERERNARQAADGAANDSGNARIRLP